MASRSSDMGHLGCSSTPDRAITHAGSLSRRSQRVRRRAPVMTATVLRSARLLKMTGVEVLVAVSIAVGVVGVVVPLLPGALLVWLAIVVWGITVGTATGWAVVAVATAVIAAGQVVK